MKLTLNVAKVGMAKGTMGWLCAQADHIKIGESKHGTEAAWLKAKDGTTICCLAQRSDICGENRIELCDQVVGSPFYADMAFTSAAWIVVKRIAELAKEVMELGEDEASGNAVLVELKR